MRRIAMICGVGALGCLAIAAARANAASAAAACPEITSEYCQTIDLSEICGPGCNVQIIGRN